MPKTWRTLRHPESVARALPTTVAPAVPAGVGPATASDDPARVELLVQEARREAFEVGRAAGREEAMASAEASRHQRVERLADQVAEAAQRAASMRTEVVEEVGREMVDLVVELAEVLVARELDGRDAIGDRIRRALALAPVGPDIVIRVSPRCELTDDEVMAIANRAGVEVLRDPVVDTTGCMVTAGGCKIDAQVSSALARVRRELESVLR